MTSASAGSAFFAGFPTLGGATDIKPALLFLRNIDAKTPPIALFDFLKPLVTNFVPIGLLVDCSELFDTDIALDSALATLLRQLATRYNGLIEIIPNVPDLAVLSPYFRMRRAAEARAGIAKLLGPTCAKSGLSIATELPSPDIQMVPDLRAAGFRNAVLVPAQTTAPDYWEDDAGVMQFIGGQLVGRDIEPQISTDVPIEIYYLDGRILAQTPGDASSYGQHSVDLFKPQATRSTKRAMLAREIHRQTGEGQDRMIALRMEFPRDGIDLSGFLGDLDKAGITYSRVAGPTSGSTTGQALFCVQMPDQITNSLEVALMLSPNGAVCTTDAKQSDIFGAAGTQIMSAAVDDGYFGFDRFGNYRLPVDFTFDGNHLPHNRQSALEMLLSATGTTRDVIIHIAPDILSNPVARGSVFAMLKGLREADIKQVFSLDGLRDKLADAGPVYILAKAAQYDNALVGNEKTAPATQEQLVNDARSAWQFFETTANTTTGLSPGSVDYYEAIPSHYPFVTLWDVASHLLACFSARSLGIIERDDYVAKVSTILEHIPDTLQNGLRLPFSTISVDGKNPHTTGFDASDFGRLLVAFRVLENAEPGSWNLSGKIAGWDIADTIKSGKLHYLDRGILRPLEDSNYVHYAVQAYALWGFIANAAYAIPANSVAFDTRMHILESASMRGLIGTEPHGLEGVELGLSAESRIIFDALFSAEMAEYRRHGKFTCVSEGALDRFPWFTYQGYQIGAVEPWQVKTKETSPAYTSSRFASEMALINTKGAYLSAALRPETYSRDLLSYVRGRAKSSNPGFSSGIFRNSGKATQNYTDLNTNAVILESVAYILNGRRPLVGEGVKGGAAEP